MLAWLEGEGIAGTVTDRSVFGRGSRGTLWRRYD
jgi:hypothetical protein